MTHTRNIFYRIPGRKGENFATELLVNLLRTKFMRDSILKKLGIPEKALENIKPGHITPQKALEQGGIPDVIIENRESFYLIENKIQVNTALQENQLNGYISQLERSQSTNKAYIFLVREEYLHKGLLEELRKNHKTNEESDLIKIVYWEDLLKHLFSLEIQDESPVIKESLECLCETVLRRTSLYDEEISFSAYEVAMLFNLRDLKASFITCEKVYKKMEQVGKYLVSNKDLNIQLGAACPLNSKYGYWSFIGQILAYKDIAESIWIGLNTNLLFRNAEDIRDADKEGEDYVFSLAITKRYLKSSDLSLPVDYFDDGEFIYIPLSKKHLVDEQDNGALESEIEKIITDVFLPNVKL